MCNKSIITYLSFVNPESISLIYLKLLLLLLLLFCFLISGFKIHRLSFSCFDDFFFLLFKLAESFSYFYKS